MKKVYYFFLLINVLFMTRLIAQQNNQLNQRWAEVDSLLDKMGQPRTALEKVNQIGQFAKSHSMKDEAIKVLLYRINIETQIEDKDITSTVQKVQTETAASKDPIQTSLLHTLEAAILSQYYQGHQSRILARTATDLVNTSDVTTWAAADFDRRIYALYTMALQQKALLQKTTGKSYSAIIDSGNVPVLRPTLFDLILHQALDYYKTNRLNGQVAEQPYILTDTAALAAANLFIEHPFTSPQGGDSLASSWLTLKFFQEGLAFHQKDKDPAAFLDLDLERIEWAYQQLKAQRSGDLSESPIDEQYLRALSQLTSEYKGQEMSKEAAYLMADYYSNSGANYQPKAGNTPKFDYQKALNIIDQYLPEGGPTADSSWKPKSKGEADLYNLRQRIMAPSHIITAEEVNVPEKPFRILVEYKNVSKLYFRVLRAPAQPGEVSNSDKFWGKIIGASPIARFEQQLPNLNDHQTHSVEIKVPALKAGTYIILASQQPDFELKDGLSANGITVSSIAYIQHDQQLFIVDRSQGNPIPNAHINFFKKSYQEGGYQYENLFSTNSDKNGRVDLVSHLSKGVSVQNMAIIHAKDTLISDAYFYLAYKKEVADEKADKRTKNINFYTDRSIYRPGQSVYFKGIATITHSDGQKSTIMTDKKPQRIYLLDANQQKIDSAVFVLNNFGSLTGSFKLPEGVLAGNFSLQAEALEGTQYFRVEEYKRPTFHVMLDTLSTAYQLGDSVTIQGKAMAYAGQPIDGAKVSISVQRGAIFPYPWIRRGVGRSFIPYPRTNAPIAHGQVTTNEKGQFTFTFLASAGAKEEIAKMPNYRFQIEAVVSDNNGESRQAEQHLVLGTQPFTVQVNVPSSSSNKLLDSLEIRTTNAAGKFMPENLTVRITALDAPKRLVRERLWERPDQFVIDSIQFIKWFPHDEYNHELDEKTWPHKTVAFETKVRTTAAGRIAVNKQLEPGWYLIEASAPGNHDQTIRDQAYVYLYTPTQPIGESPVYNWSDTLHATANAGETASLQVASSAGKVYLLSSLTRQENGKTVTSFDHQLLQGSPVKLEYTLKQTDTKGAFVDYAFVKDNRAYTGRMQVNLKQPKDDFDIDFMTYRDKTEPGSTENWTIRIKRAGQTVKDMELLSAMYDGSLDQFQPHDWQFPELFQQSYLNNSAWDYRNSFNTARSQMKPVPQNSVYFTKIYNQLIFNNAINLVQNKEVMFSSMGVQRNTNKRMAIGYSTEAKAAPIAAEQQDMAGDAEQDSTTITPPAQQRIRSDFKETAFFFPQLQSDANGDFQLKFTMPDALTTWKWMNLAYDKQLNSVMDFREIISQKTLMVQPNLPRFLRAGDKITLSAKISNLSTKTLAGKAVIVLTDPATGKDLSGWIPTTQQDYSVSAGQSVAVHFPLKVPEDYTGPIDVSVQAAADQFSDGEKRTLPVLTNKLLVTETLPIYLKSGRDGTTSFKMDKLLQSGNKDQLQNQALVFEFNTNPVWYAVGALPYLSRKTYEGAEAIFSQYYAQALGNYIVHQYPTIENTFNAWKKDTSHNGALSAELEKNQELKSVLLEQTPWVVQAQSEAEQKRALANFFDQKTLTATQKALLNQLKQMQANDGSFSWIKGGSADTYITQYIAGAIGRLKLLNLLSGEDQQSIVAIGREANDYLIKHYESQYQLLKAKHTAATLEKYQPSPSELQYLYTRSFFTSADKLTEAERFYLKQEKQDWQKQSIFLKAMIAATQFRLGDHNFATQTVIPSILESAVQNEALGMYWKQSVTSYLWYQAPLETQTMVMNVLQQMQQKEKNEQWATAIGQMQHWLIMNKQTNHWGSSKSTADACFALLYNNQQLESNPAQVQVSLGDQEFTSDKQEAGTGYFKRVIPADHIQTQMGKVTIKVTAANNSDDITGYGALYWQYLQPGNLVTGSEKGRAGLSVEKQLFIQRTTAQGSKLEAVSKSHPLKVGDKLVIRLILKSDRPMDYVHLQDLRGAGLEPDNVLSGYQWKDGLGYYETTRDVSSDFYFSQLPKGTFVFEYPAHVTHKGAYSAGTATLECLYAPEFSAHSQGFGIQAD